MKKLYLKKFRGDISNLAQLELDNSFIVDMEQTEEKKILVIEQQGQDIGYKILAELPKDQGKVISIGGFVEICKKPEKFSKTKENDSSLMASLFGEIPVLRELPKHFKVIGYVKLADSDTYIAVMKKKVYLFPVLLPILAGVLLISLSLSPDIKTPIDLDNFIQGDVGEGQIEIEQGEMAKSDNLRIIMNGNPTLKDGKMNLLIENNKESNVCSMVAEVYLISEVDIDGNIIERYDEPIKIAETPLINPGENIEYVGVTEDVEIVAGKYNGRVLYTAYKISAEGATPIGQVAGQINLVVK